jgi:hypothetical protein
MKSEALRHIVEKCIISNFMKIRPVEAELFHCDRQTDRQTDMMALMIAFRNIATAPKN